MWTYDFMQWLTFGRCHGCNKSQLYLCIESCHSCWLRSTGCTNLPMCSLSVPLTDPTWSILHYWDPAGTTFNSLSFLLCLSLLLASSDLTWLLVAELILMCGAHVANTRLHCAMIWLYGYVVVSVCLSVCLSVGLLRKLDDFREILQGVTLWLRNSRLVLYTLTQSLVLCVCQGDCWFWQSWWCLLSTELDPTYPLRLSVCKDDVKNSEFYPHTADRTFFLL